MYRETRRYSCDEVAKGISIRHANLQGVANWTAAVSATSPQLSCIDRSMFVNKTSCEIEYWIVIPGCLRHVAANTTPFHHHHRCCCFDNQIKMRSKNNKYKVNFTKRTLADALRQANLVEIEHRRQLRLYLHLSIIFVELKIAIFIFWDDNTVGSGA